MADALNTVQTVVGNPTYGKTGTGFKASVSELRKYEKTLLKFLNQGERLAHTRYLMHKSLPKGMGDTLNLRRYFDIEKDPRKLKMDKNTTTGPELKELHGAAVEFKVEWYGNGIKFNDVVTQIHLDDLMRMAMPMLMENAAVVRDNIAALAMYEGASKAYIKAYDATTGAVTLGAPAGKATAAEAKAEVAGPLNHNILRAITKKFINNTETYALSSGNATVRAKIKPVSNGKYRVLTPEDGMDDLLDDKMFLENFVRGISAQELRDNKIVSTFRYVLEVIDNHLTISLADAGLTSIHLEGEGDHQVAFVFGDEFGADLSLDGEKVRMFAKQPNTVDSGDVYGRQAFVTYKFVYGAQVVNSKAIYAVVYTPNTHVTGAYVASATSNPQQ